MKCPVCSTDLATGVPRAYETLCEHVFDPNGMPLEKPTLVCTNHKCMTFGRGFWATLDFEGSFYPDDSSGVSAENIPGLPDNIYADKDGEKLPSLEAAYSYKKAHELLGRFPLHRTRVFDFFKKAVDVMTCKDCGGSGLSDKRHEDGWKLDCPSCMDGISRVCAGSLEEIKNGN